MGMKSNKMKLKELDILLYSPVKFYCTLSGLNLSNLNWGGDIIFEMQMLHIKVLKDAWLTMAL